MYDNIIDIQNTNQTVGYYLFDYLNKEGITEAFGVPGDYNFSLLDILERYDKINFINCRNELNAGYAAESYARMKGLSVLITTFGVGELSACNAIAGAYSERVPIIHIVGAPKTMEQQEHKMMHHTLLDGDFDAFRRVYQNLTAYTAVISSDNALLEIPKAVEKAKETKQPVYLLVATDVANQPITERVTTIYKQQTNQNTLQAAVNHIEQLVKGAKKPVLIPDVMVLRYNLQAKVQEIVEKLDIPVATMMMGKGSFDETHRNYIGLYAGSMGSTEVQRIVEASDCIISVGPIWTDYNTGSFTANLNPVNMVEIQPTYVKVGMSVYENILITDLLNELAARLEKKNAVVPAVAFPYNRNDRTLDENITSSYYYPRFQQMLKENDVVIADAGTFAFGLAELRLPKGAVYVTQGGWGSIGYAVPAVFGACVADKNRRVIAFTGDGSFQMTAQEVSSIVENDCRPIIFLVNNKEYTIEKYLNIQKQTHYNDIPEWDYKKLVEAFGKEAFIAKVYSNRELDEAIKQAEEQWKEKICFIEIFAPSMDAPTMVHNIHQKIEKMQMQ